MSVNVPPRSRFPSWVRPTVAFELAAPGALMGHVTAPNEETALARAYDEFEITSPAERKRIIVQPTTRD
jgi:hypothetical protein